jgi:hypothetical protein
MRAPPAKVDERISDEKTLASSDVLVEKQKGFDELLNREIEEEHGILSFKIEAANKKIEPLRAAGDHRRTFRILPGVLRGQ